MYKLMDQPPRRISRLGMRILTWLLHALIQHSPIIAQVLSISLIDSRIIIAELDGLEVTLKRFTIGTVIDFKGRDDSPLPTGMLSPPMSPDLDSAHGNLSPPSSPLVYMSFNDPFATSPKPIPAEEPVSSSFGGFARLSQAKRRATKSYIRVTSTTGQIFRRAMGRAYGSVSINIAFTDIAVILPHDTAPSEPPRQAPQAIPSPGCKPRFTQFKPPFLRTLSAAPSQLAAADEGLGFTTLATLEGVSTTRIGLGFGPRKGWLAEDTLTAEINLADLGARVDGLERVSYMLKRRKESKRNIDTVDRGKKNPWAPSALPRVSIFSLIGS